MKKLLFILPVFFFTLAVNAQQTEDELYIGKTFGNYKGTGIIIPDTDRNTKPINGQTTVTGYGRRYLQAKLQFTYGAKE